MTLVGCYALQPTRGTVPQPGTVIGLDINDAGRVALGGSMGPEISQVEGRLLQADNTEYVVGVTALHLLQGGEQVWHGEQVHVKKEYCHVSVPAALFAGRSAGAGSGGDWSGRVHREPSHRRFRIVRPTNLAWRHRAYQSTPAALNRWTTYQNLEGSTNAKAFQLSMLCLAAGVVSACSPEKSFTRRSARPPVCVHQRGPGYGRGVRSRLPFRRLSSRTATRSALGSVTVPQNRIAPAMTVTLGVDPVQGREGRVARTSGLPRRHAPGNRSDGRSGFDGNLESGHNYTFLLGATHGQRRGQDAR